MAKRRELGGGRIGSGEKMTVGLEGYGRSTHNLNTVVKTTMGFGTVLPIHYSVVLAGDTREIDIDAMLMTKPTEGPLFDSAQLEVNVFSIEIRLWIAKLHMNLLKKGLTMADIKLPLIEMTADKIDWTKEVNNQQIGSSCIFKYLGVSGIGDTTDATVPKRFVNALTWLMYWDIVKNYYANKQENIGAVISAPAVVKTVTTVSVYYGGAWNQITQDTQPVGNVVELVRGGRIAIDYTGTQPKPQEIRVLFQDGGEGLINEVFGSVIITTTQIIGDQPRREYVSRNINHWGYISEAEARLPEVVTFPLSNLDDIKMDVLAAIKQTTAFIINGSTTAPFGTALGKNGTVFRKLSSQEGLAVKTYKSDMLQNWLNTADIDSVNARTAIEVVGGKFTIDNFLLKNKFYNYLNRIAVAGGTVNDMMEVTYDVESKSKPEIPIFEGGMSKELYFDQQLSTAPAEGQPTGTITGRGVTGHHKGGKVRITNDDSEHMYYMVLASLTPRLTYTQGNRFDINLETYDDFHKPEFDQIGFQALTTDNMASWDTKVTATGVKTFRSAGYQPAWTHYQTEIDRAFGLFAEQNAEGWMIFDRNYEKDATNKRIKDLTTYIDPAKYNSVFAYAGRDAQNVWAQFSIKDRAIRKMSANQMPKM